MNDDLIESLQFKLITQGWDPRDDMRREMEPCCRASAYLVLSAIFCVLGALASVLIFALNH